MPIYEFRCKECGHTFERLVFATGSMEEERCPRCGREAERILSSFCNFRTSATPLRTPSQSCSSPKGFS